MKGFNPSVLFALSWSGKGEIPGGNIKAEDAQEAPNVVLTPLSFGEGLSTTFTIAMVEPDATSEDGRHNGPYRHWLVSEIFYNPHINLTRLITATEPGLRSDSADFGGNRGRRLGAEGLGCGTTRTLVSIISEAGRHTLPASEAKPR